MKAWTWELTECYRSVEQHNAGERASSRPALPQLTRRPQAHDVFSLPLTPVFSLPKWRAGYMRTISQSEIPAKTKLWFVFLPLSLTCDWQIGCFFPAAVQNQAASTQAPYMPWPCQTRPLRKWKMSLACLQKPERARGLACLFVYLFIHSSNCLFTSYWFCQALVGCPPCAMQGGCRTLALNSVLTAQHGLELWWELWGWYCRKFFLTVLV